MTDKHNVVPHAETAPTRAVMHPMVERMMATNPTPEALEKLLTLQREWEKGEAKRAYDSALVELKRDLPPFLKRDKTVDYTSAKGRTHYTHTSLAGAMETVTPLLSNYGFSLTWKPGSDDKGQVVVTAKLAHRLGHSEESTLKAAPDATGNKNGPQAVASTVTLLARYACLGLLGLATADMAEPTGEGAPASTERVDTARNMKAMAALAKSGKSKEEVEKYVGRSIQEWTGKDLDRLRAWIAPATGTKPTTTEADGPLIGQAEYAKLEALMKEYALAPKTFGQLVADGLQREVPSLRKVKVPEYEVVTHLFERMANGEIGMDIKAGKWVFPPEHEMPLTDEEQAAMTENDKNIPF